MLGLITEDVKDRVHSIKRVSSQLVTNLEKTDVENVLHDGRNIHILSPIIKMVRVIMSPILGKIYDINKI